MTDLLEALPKADQAFLGKFGNDVELERHGANVHVIFKNYDLGTAYEPRIVDLMIQLPPGYPNMGLDMYWTLPSVHLAGTVLKPDRCDVTQTFGSHTWQRWSRHPSQGWRAGIDHVQNFYASIRVDLNKGR